MSGSRTSNSSNGDSGSHRNEQQALDDFLARPFCSHACLLSLCQRKAIEPSCPNAQDHGQAHMSRSDLRLQIRTQLAVDRSRADSCVPLRLYGSRGTLLKIRLKEKGYTLVAKGTESFNKSSLYHEAEMYEHMEGLQGQYVPVCCGIVDLDLPYYCRGTKLKHLLLLSYAGISLARLKLPIEAFGEKLAKAREALDRLQVVHGDLEPRNMVYDEKKGLMIIDFERSQIVTASVEYPSSQRKRNTQLNTLRLMAH